MKIDNLREKSRIELNSLLQNIQALMNRRDNGYLKVLKINKEQEALNVKKTRDFFISSIFSQDLIFYGRK